MFAAQRIEEIKSYLLLHKSVDIATLSAMFNVTDVTIRRDLDKLANDGFLIKTHGGAILKEADEDESFSSHILNYVAKQKIARTLISLLGGNETIFVGSGSTCFLLKKYLQDMPSLTVVTNNVTLAVSLGTTSKNIVLTGGPIVNKNGILTTDIANDIHYLDGIYVNKAIISVDGVDMMAGFTSYSLDISKLVKKLRSVSKELIILADSSKFDKIAPYHCCTLDEADCVITNQCDYDEYKNFFFSNDVKLFTCYDFAEQSIN